MIASLAVLLTIAAPKDALPGEMLRNEHVVHSVDRSRPGFARVTYRFKTHRNELLTFIADYDEAAMRRGAEQLGLPAWAHQRHDSRLDSMLDQAIDEGLMRRENGRVRADPQRVARFYDPLTRPIAEWMKAWLVSRNRDTREERIALAMAFVQDIPYSIPREHSTWSTAGVVAPPQLILEGWGDCDSKAFFFLGLLRVLIDPKDVLIVFRPGHLFTAIAGKPARPNDSFFTFRERTFLVAETAGPGRLSLGQKGDGVSGSWNLEPLQE